MAPETIRRASLVGAALALGLWSANAWLSFSTITPGDRDVVQEAASAQARNPPALGAFHLALRRAMIDFDRATDLPPRRQGLSFWLLIGLPAFAAVACGAAAILPAASRGSLSGEVRWARSLLDPDALPGVEITRLLRVTANVVEKHGPKDGTYDVLKTVAVARLGKPCRKHEHEIALPFRIEDLPLGIPLAIDCLFAEDFPPGPDPGARVHLRRCPRVSLSSARPAITDIVLNLERHDR